MWNPGGWSGIPVHQDMSGSRILPRRSSSTFGVWKGAVYNMPQSNVRKEPPPACHRQGEVVPYVCIRPPHPITRVWFSLTLSADDMGHRRSVSTSFKALGIQRVFVWYSEVFGLFSGYSAFLPSSKYCIYHTWRSSRSRPTTLFIILKEVNVEFGRVGQAFSCTRSCQVLEFYHVVLLPHVVS